MRALATLLHTLALLACTRLALSQSPPTTYPLPEPCTGPACSNPAHSTAYQDAAIIRRGCDGWYFRFSKSNSTGVGLSVAAAPALAGPWNYYYSMLGGGVRSPVVSDPAAVDLWAPQPYFHNGLYYVYFGVYTTNTALFDLLVATSETMEPDSWTDHGSIGIPPSASSEYVRLGGALLASALEPTVPLVPAYMVFDSYNAGVFGVPMDKSLLRVEGRKPRVTELVADQVNPPPDAGNKTEGPNMIQNGRYIYIFYSMGNCCGFPNADLANAATAYKVKVCRTELANGPTGPYADRAGLLCAPQQNGAGTLVLPTHDQGQVFAPGSIGFVNDADGALVMTYQYKNASASNKQLRFSYNYLEFDADGWPVLVQNRNSTVARLV